MRLLECERGGQARRRLNRAVARDREQILAFGDAERDLVARRAAQARAATSPTRRRLRLRPASRFQRAGRHEPEGRLLALRDVAARGESALGSITGGNGAIYAVRRSDYVEWPFGHDQGFPNLMVQKRPPRGLRAGGARVREASRDNEDEFRRKVRMLPWSWRYLFEAGRCGGCRRCTCSSCSRTGCSRYASGFLHVGLLGDASIALVGDGWIYQAALAAQALWLALAAAGKLEAAACRARDSPGTTC